LNVATLLVLCIPIFGTANQLLAALTLVCLAVWLMVKGKTFLFALIPAVFMMVTTAASLVNLLFTKYIPQPNFTLAVADLLLLALGAAFVVLSHSILRRTRNVGISKV
jgi:carbon starvation protein